MQPPRTPQAVLPLLISLKHSYGSSCPHTSLFSSTTVMDLMSLTWLASAAGEGGEVLKLFEMWK